MTPVAPNDVNDQMILGLLTARHPGGVELLYDQWGPLTYAIARSILGNPVEAEEVVRNAFLTLWREPKLALEHAETLRGYLCTLVACDARLRSLKCHPNTAHIRKVSFASPRAQRSAVPPSQDELPGAPISRQKAQGVINEVGLGSDR